MATNNSSKREKLTRWIKVRKTRFRYRKYITKNAGVNFIMIKGDYDKFP